MAAYWVSWQDSFAFRPKPSSSSRTRPTPTCPLPCSGMLSSCAWGETSAAPAPQLAQAAETTPSLAQQRSLRAPRALRAAARAGWERRWWGQLGCVLQRALASTLLGRAPGAHRRSLAATSARRPGGSWSSPRRSSPPGYPCARDARCA